MKKFAYFLGIMVVIFISGAFTGKEKKTFVRKDQLSDYGFFTGKLADLKPADNVFPYQLNSALFSNYAEKARFITMPPGQSAIYNPDSVFDMPVGTVLIKNFYYPNDFRDAKKGRRILETRLLVHEAEGWTALPYIWNDEQTDAYYDVAGDAKSIQYIDSKGKKVSTTYLVPNKNQCKGCHAVGDRIIPIGPAARHLNTSIALANGKTPQLSYWKEHGLLNELPGDQVPANSDYTDPSTGDLNQRARAYLDINCGHCHSAKGAANTSGLYLDIHNNNPTALGIMKSPVAAGRGSGNLDFDIVPGHADKSILIYRMNTTDPGIAMPEIGREQIHAEGLALLREWINKMKPAP
ncbi:SO2930 family diheme c-type cytochrome [Flavihumibacter fluvii]|uniref:SO2930 family diheme c-type cytochrome n=1 Tax=Flavihumibacter fluvii TaxID=2838157 RepID=UPI001BDE17EE|nr:SO2930 family diheme c-type cytochrome [Flavihumibacter fluvii]ULQ54795.1 hypothetical protein KJS93_10760 [Flavihumibacter fluvii]